MAGDDEEADRALAEVEARLEALEARARVLTPLVDQAQQCLAALRRRRQLAQRAGVRGLGAEARNAARTLATAAGCAAVIAGTTALEPSLGPAALVLSFLLLVVEGSR